MTSEVLILPTNNTLSASSALEELKQLKQWVLWRYEQRNGAAKPTKPPYQPNGHRAAPDDPSTWSSYDDVASVADQFDGIGIMLADGYAGVDFDDVRDPQTGEILPTAHAWIQRLDSYTEVSPSGTGVHCIVKGSLNLPRNEDGHQPTGRKLEHIEVYDTGRYFTFTGRQVPGTSGTINERSDALQSIYGQIDMVNHRLTYEAAGDATRALLVKEPDKFSDLQAGNWEPYYSSKSEAVQGFLCMLAMRTDGNRDEMDKQFRASGLYSDQWVAKWARRSKSEIQKAVNLVSHDRRESNAIGEFARPAVKGTHRDYVIQPMTGMYDGWFPRGDVSLIAGATGTGKTTQMIQLLLTQRDGGGVFNHQTSGLPFIVVMGDRSRNATLRTIERMKFDPNRIPKEVLHSDGSAGVRELKEIIERCNPIPAVVFVEGADLIVEDPFSPKAVAPFIRQLQRLAEHYHIAVVLSLGTPKMRPSEKYASLREQIYGTIAWGRMTETVIHFEHWNGDDTGDRRTMTVLLRNGKAEQFTLVFNNGRLVQDTGKGLVVEKDPADKSKSLADILTWAQSQGSFTRKQAAEALDVDGTTMWRKLDDLRNAKALTYDKRNKMYRVKE
jgi:hypothetical protein